MCKVKMLREVVMARLSAAAEEIFVLFERTLAEYEEELCRSKEKNERQQQLLDAVLTPEVRIRRTVLCSDVQQDPEPPHIKEEEEQLWSSLEGEQLVGSAPVTSEDVEEEPQFSQLHQRQIASSSAQQMEIENVEEDCGGSEPSSSSHPDSNLQPAYDDETPDASEQANSAELKETQAGVSVRHPATDDWTPDRPEPETENSADDWKEKRKPQSDLKTLTNSDIPGDGKECNTGKKVLCCSECGKRFKGKPGEKPLLCSVCVQRPMQSARVVTHKRSHSGEKAFRCSVCKKEFRFKGDVVRHIRIHTGEKPFSCSVCGKSFTQSACLHSHMRTHTGEKPYSCSLCPKQFIRSGVLARHMRVHTGEKPYSCSVCNASFTLSQSLLKHMRIHTGEKPFSCSVCDKTFTQKGHLTQHMTLHTGERAFTCRVCGRKFTRQSRVKNHKCVTESSSSK